MHDDTNSNLDRRTFLKRSAVVPLGVAGWTAQDDSESARVTRRMAFEEPQTLSDDYVRRVVLLTDRLQEEPDTTGIAECAFADWPTDQLTAWEGLIVEWRNRGFGEILTQDPEVRAEQMVELRIVVDERESPVELGTPYIIGGRVECPEGYVGVTANRIPGLRIKTGPNVSTEG